MMVLSAKLRSSPGEPSPADRIASRLREDPSFRQRYTLGPVLGEGGFGRVFEARQSATDQKVAIKALQVNADAWTGGSKATRLQRFEREVRLCARVHHPNIVRLIDAGSVADNLTYAAFEFVPGQTLERVLISEGALTVEEATHVMTQVLDGLCCAHRAGILHRDIKPANIMLTSTGLRRNAMILDFGIGVLVDPSMADDHDLTTEAQFLGTPRYAAPEQLRGEVLTSRADIYAWGLTFLECLLGRPVFQGTSLAHMLAKKQDREVELPEDIAKSPLGTLLLLATRSDVLDRNVTVEGLYAALTAVPGGDAWRASPRRPVREAAGLDHTEDDDGTLTSFSAQPALTPETLATERRGLSSLCIQLSINWSEATDEMHNIEEVYDSLLQTMHDLVVGKTYREGGTLAGHVGTRFLLHFTGSKRGQGSVERAARVAFQILQTVARFGERLHQTRGWTVGGSASLVHGWGVCRATDGLASPPGFSPGVYVPTDDDAVELASCARPGTLVITADVAELLGDGYSTLKSTLVRTPTAVDLREIVEVLPRIRSGCFEREEHAIPLVGREAEMTALRAVADRVLTERGQAVYLSGEPGLGKSRLVVALRDEFLERCPTWLETTCSAANAHSPLHAMLELLRAWAGVVPRDSVEVVERKVEGLLTRYGCHTGAAVALLLPFLVEAPTDPSDLEAPRRLALTIETICRLLVTAGEGSRRVVVVVEDIHWADPTTLRLIGELLPKVSESGILLVLTAREDFDAPWSREFDARIRLARLSSEEAHAMLEALDLPQGGLSREEILTRSDGVPLFVREVAMMAATTTRPASLRRFPAKLECVLDDRLGEAGPAKRLAQLASVLGREFRHDDLRAISGLDDLELETQLRTLVDLRLVVRRRSADVMTYGFRHALVRDAAYESIVSEERRLMHAAVAHQLAGRDPSLSSKQPELLAEHLECAGQYGPAVGLLLAAGQLASRCAANVEAERHLRRGLALLPKLAPGADALQTELGLSLSLSGVLMAKEGFSCGEIGVLFARARTLCHELGLTHHLLPVLFGGGAFHVLRAELSKALDLARTAAKLAQASADESQKLPAALFLAGTSFLIGNLGDGVRALEQGMETYDPQVHRAMTEIYSYQPGIAARGYLGLGLALIGRVDESQTMSARNIAEAKAFGHAHTMIHVLVRSCFIRTLFAQPEITRRLAEETIELAKSKGFPLWWANGAVFRGWARVMLGDAAGLDDLRFGIEAWQATGARANVPWFRTLLAESLGKVGNLEDGLANIEMAVDESLRSGETMFLADTYRVQAELIAAANTHATVPRPDPREPLLGAFETAERQGSRWLALRASRLALAPPFVGEGDALEAARARLRLALGAISGGADLPDLRLGRAMLE